MMFNTLKLFVSAALAIMLTGCGKDHEHEKAAEKKTENSHGHKEGEKHEEPTVGGTLRLSDNEINAAGIRVAEVTEAEVNDALRVTALVRPHPSKVARIAPRVPGRIVAVHASLGDRVTRGQTLAVLDSIELGQARGEHLQALAELRIAQATYDRISKLVEEEIIASKEKLRAQADLEKARAVELARRGQIQLLGGAPSEKGAGASSTFAITAPFAGVVIEQNDAAVGTLSQPDKPLYTVADLSIVSVEGNLHEQDLGRVTPGSIAEVSLAAYPGTVFKGKVIHLSAVMDKDTRTIPVRIEVTNPEGKLRPEMFASVAIASSGKVRVIAVPNEAVVLMQGVTTVFVEGAQGFEPRIVQTGERTAVGVTITSGIKPRDMVVVAGAYELKARSLKSQLGSGHAH